MNDEAGGLRDDVWSVPTHESVYKEPKDQQYPPNLYTLALLLADIRLLLLGIDAKLGALREEKADNSTLTGVWNT